MMNCFNSTSLTQPYVGEVFAVAREAYLYLKTLDRGHFTLRQPAAAQMALAMVENCINESASARLYRLMEDLNIDLSMGRDLATDCSKFKASRVASMERAYEARKRRDKAASNTKCGT
jgi:hypothetical protein